MKQFFENLFKAVQIGYICGMSMKWYIGTLLGLVSIFVVQQQEVVVQNQEIVLHFDNHKVTSEEVQYSIELLTKQLHDAGVLSINTVLQKEGVYKISYHSHLNVDSIKESIDLDAFASQFINQLPFSDFPSDNDSSIFSIEVYDIQQDVSGFAGLDNGLFIEIKQDFNRGSQVLPLFNIKQNYKFLNRLSLQSGKLIDNPLGLSIADRSYAIPEVRAGPFVV